MTTLVEKAAAVADALAALEAAVVEFRDACHAANRSHLANAAPTFSGYSRADLAVFADPLRFVRAGVASKHALAHALGVEKRPAGYKIADAVSQ